MKATGIVRRIDDLGRVVIPKEIRRTMRIREGEPLEIFTENGGSVVFKKYSPVGEQSTLAGYLCEAYFKVTSRPFAICDRDSIIAVSGISRKELDGKAISTELDSIMHSRQMHKSDKGVPLSQHHDAMAVIAVPIIAGGDLCGCAAFLEGEGQPGELEVKLAQAAAHFFARQMED